MTFLLRAAALGLATGSRSAMGLAALAVTADASDRPRSWLTDPWTTRVAVAASAAELVGDQLPRTPSRLEARGFIPRLVLGGAGAAILGRREGEPIGVIVQAGALGVLAAALGAFAGSGWRQWADARFGQDRPGAVLEDAAALVTVAVATHSAFGRGRSTR
jgi:uncharacterized membrane protein